MTHDGNGKDLRISARQLYESGLHVELQTPRRVVIRLCAEQTGIGGFIEFPTAAIAQEAARRISFALSRLQGKDAAWNELVRGILRQAEEQAAVEHATVPVTPLAVSRAEQDQRIVTLNEIIKEVHGNVDYVADHNPAGRDSESKIIKP